MNRVTVPHPQGFGQLYMTIEQAQELIGQLTQAIAAATVEELRPPHIDTDGWLNRPSLYIFFMQIYDKPAGLRNHAGKLFGNLIRSSIGQFASEPIGFIVRCGKCKRPLDADCTHRGIGHSFYRNEWPYDIKADSLKEHANEFLARHTRNITPAVHADFKLLLEHL